MNHKANQLHTIIYRERVTPSLPSYLPTLLFLPALTLTLAPFSWVGGLIAGSVLSVAAIIVMVALSPVITVTESVLKVGAAIIERSYLAKPVMIDESQKFAATRTELSTLAYLVLQPSVKNLVRIDITDSNDPTPYWLFSSRKPQLIIQALSEG